MNQNKQQIASKQQQINSLNRALNHFQQLQRDDLNGNGSHKLSLKIENCDLKDFFELIKKYTDQLKEIEQNLEQERKSSINNEANINGEDSDDNQEDEQDRSSNIEEYKSDDDEDQIEDSNLKSDNKDEDQDKSDEDLKKQEPSGKKCFNKLCNSKKIYKKLRSKVEHAKYRFFCRQCYESYYSNDFCQFCEQIYSSTANSDDDDQWIGCDSCSRWNHIDCQKKFRNKNIIQIKNEQTQYLCLTCSYKAKQKNGTDIRTKGKKQAQPQQQKLVKQNIEISRDQRTQIFNKKLQGLPSLQFFLQNYNFRLWINENLIKDDLQNLRESSKRNQEQSRKNKKMKTQ